MSTLKSWKIPPSLNGQRFDLAAVELAALSRKKVRSLIDSGGAFLNQKPIWIAKFAVRGGDVLELRLNEEAGQRSALDIDLTPESIIRETEDFVVLNKPVGISVDSVANDILAYVRHLDSRFRGLNLKLAHRLDKDTSGLLIIAKNEAVRTEFEKLFARREVRKVYRALCFDTPRPETDSIVFPIVQHSKGENKYFAVVEGEATGNGSKTAGGGKNVEGRGVRPKPARTDYWVLESLAGKRVSYVEFYPHTGRPHQIRVHARAIGNPVLGDKVYALHLAGRHPYYQTAPRQMLHAWQLEFTYKNQKYNLQAPLPQDFERVLKLSHSKLISNMDFQNLTSD